MMSAQMLAAATNNAEAAAEIPQDSMKMLDAVSENSQQPVVCAFISFTSVMYVINDCI